MFSKVATLQINFTTPLWFHSIFSLDFNNFLLLFKFFFYFSLSQNYEAIFLSITIVRFDSADHEKYAFSFTPFTIYFSTVFLLRFFHEKNCHLLDT